MQWFRTDKQHHDLGNYHVAGWHESLTMVGLE
jgi:hypothetical protein